MEARTEDFLLAYRATPHSSTKIPPATLLFGSPIRSKVPQLTSFDQNDELRAKDGFAKIMMKQNHDKNPNIQPSTLKVGDNALIKKTGMSRV